MKTTGYLNINRRGTARFTKNRVGLNWDEVAVKISLEVPDELFKRPFIEATITVSKDVLPKEQSINLILNSKDLIEQSTGAKIDFKIVPYEEKKELEEK